ncbi:hypothetical protein Y032_0002g1020 [Ancylostoma ceylanicum]|uniref:Uncharacterized protein n=1 Tax=Ancylostoma ceylanicum TaxID=53326 RepID=A0A016VYI4_9BILA|nr:hypothetical protein Y032_0002g1020 [Ancylostoma ceylanicum]
MELTEGTAWFPNTEKLVRSITAAAEQLRLASKVGVFDRFFGFQVHPWNQRIEKNQIPLTSRYSKRPDTLPLSKEL